mmetsp:Transcript_50410/g.109871  ORF Transcript_50410/g.109871 Transcript_50410/m.109871 type:complete len:103 (-) Transcript_50410:34-342(-)
MVLQGFLLQEVWRTAASATLLLERTASRYCANHKWMLLKEEDVLLEQGTASKMGRFSKKIRRIADLSRCENLATLPLRLAIGCGDGWNLEWFCCEMNLISRS